MISRTTYFGLMVFVLAVIAVILHPLRPAAGQDDAAYAFFAIQLAQGHWQVPVLLLSGAWPQSLLGSLAIRAWPSVNPLSLLMGVSFLVFAFSLLFFARRSGREPRPIWTLGLFLFPVTLQYGTNYLTEIFAVAFLLIYVDSGRRLFAPQVPALAWLVVGAMPSLLILQRQTVMVVPFAFSFAAFLCARRGMIPYRRALILAAGIAFAVLVHLFVPKNPVQANFLSGYAQIWVDKGLWSLLTIVNRIIQLPAALGLFLLPAVFYVKWTPKTLVRTLALQGVVTALVFALPSPPLTAGVLFTDYLPRLVGSAFIGAGIWGLSAMLMTTRTLSREVRISALLALSMYVLFNSYMNVGDIKYVLPLALTLAFLISPLLPSPTRLQTRIGWGYVALVCLTSLFANAYYLDTIEARWLAAKKLVDAGVSRAEISAGYGHDLFYFGESCAQKALLKVEQAPEPERSMLFEARILRTLPRPFEDERIPTYSIKPSRLGGVGILRQLTDVKGDVFPYETLGILKNELQILTPADPRAAWCFR